MSKQVEVLEIPPLELETMSIKIVGDSPLIVHAWDEKAKQEMLDKQMKKAKQGKKAKDPKDCYRKSLYWLDENGNRIKPGQDVEKHEHFGVPAVMFKAAAVNAANEVGLHKTKTRQAFRVLKEFVKINGKPSMREDMVKIAMGTADIRYRGEFKEWSAVIQVQFNANRYSAEQIVNLFNTAGFCVGVGEWRPQRGGDFGMFHVA